MLKLGGYGVVVPLRNTPDICWVNGNSYARTELPDYTGMDAELVSYYEEFRVFTNSFGQCYMISSINGIGEVRWTVNSNTRTTEELEAVKHFAATKSEER